MAYPTKIREEELKQRIADDIFGAYDTSRIIGNIDFCVSSTVVGHTWSFLWAEAKRGTGHDIYASFVQLVLTIGKARTQDRELPPAFLGAFDAEKIAFLPYSEVMDVFSRNDFNWNVTPSDHGTAEFRLLYERAKTHIDDKMLLFHYDRDMARLQEFVAKNFVAGKTGGYQIEVTRNNFVSVFLAWERQVKPTIRIDWDKAKKAGLLSGDFYLADLLSRDNSTIREKLYVLLKSDHYEFDRSIDDVFGSVSVKQAEFKDEQKAHSAFWRLYRRPPREEYWDYIVERKDLLVPQDVRERRGAFFTPAQWVQLSQEYLAEVLGDNWQDEYTVWDCCAGTGNLLAGLTNKYNIYASTLDQADVDVMKDRIQNGANLLESHVFQFDFLNDSFDSDKIPDTLKEIIQDPEKRKKLLIYINPPYAEAPNRRTISGTGENRTGVATSQYAYSKYCDIIGLAARELYALFLARIYDELHNCVIGNFSKIKSVQAPLFKKFRDFFRAELKSLFLVPANTFDNVAGQFPIGFFVWDTCNQRNSTNIEIISNVYDSKQEFITTKEVASYDGIKTINDWIIATRTAIDIINIGFMSAKGADFQNANYVFIINNRNLLPHPRGTDITNKNIKEISVYISVRKVIKPTWLNDRDQFMTPLDSWKEDFEFSNNCLAYTLFCHANNIVAQQDGTNHWIPFTEQEVDAKDRFKSHFMTDYISGKNRPAPASSSFPQIEQGALVDFAARATPSQLAEITAPPPPQEPLEFSPEAHAVFDAGREVWRYYHSKPGVDVNASLYDIKEYFQGRDARGRMHPRSTDEEYNRLMAVLQEKLQILASKIEPKVYEHGFLRR